MHETTEIRLNERGDETHESWVLIRANRSQGTPVRLFDSEIAHMHTIGVTITRCSRRRSLNHDRLFGEQVLMQLRLSEAQWGAFVSSFGDGSGVPATLTFLAGEGHVPSAPAESRLDQSHADVRDAADRSLEAIQESYKQVMDAFEAGGKRVLREALRDLGIRLKNAPSNMEFAAKSLTEHVETVVTKARADIEGMVLAAAERGELPSAPLTPFELGPGDAEEQPDAEVGSATNDDGGAR